MVIIKCCCFMMTCALNIQMDNQLLDYVVDSKSLLPITVLDNETSAKGGTLTKINENQQKILISERGYS
jgi:hypothetical protein